MSNTGNQIVISTQGEALVMFNVLKSIIGNTTLDAKGDSVPQKAIIHMMTLSRLSVLTELINNSNGAIQIVFKNEEEMYIAIPSFNLELGIDPFLGEALQWGTKQKCPPAN